MTEKQSKVTFKVGKNGFLVRTGPWPRARKGALADSIKKWKFLTRHPDLYEMGPATCALCHLYIDDACTGCPISTFTGMQQCMGSFYRQYPSEEDAQQELNFLLSIQRLLYPKGKPKRKKAS